MLPPKNGKPITFKPTQQLREQTEAIADSLGESLSDYVRKSVEQRNAQQQNVCSICGVINGGHTGGCPRNSTHKNNTDNQPRTVSEYLKDVETHKNNTVSKPEPFKSFPKGGGKK
jgi:hypothetical protein